MECSCCGCERPKLTGLQCHEDVKVCRDCITWLRDHSGMITTTPIFPVADVAAAVAFYDRAGFETRIWRAGGFGFVTHEGESVFDLDHHVGHDPTTNGAGCFLVVHDATGWHDRITAQGIDTTAVEDMPWGMREFQFTDPDGNHVRIGQPI